MIKYCDLHTHSIFSDGTDTPAQIIDLAVQSGLSAVALCDHNTIDGLPDFHTAASGKSIEAISGAEFSVDYNGTELHLLGLYIDDSHFHSISELMHEVTARKEKSNIDLIESLKKVNIILDYDTIKRKTPHGKINRAHIAAALTEKGYTDSISQAFETLLSPAAGHYNEPKRLTFWEMLSFLKSIRAVTVLAHPFLNLSKEALIEFLPKAKENGLIGMETIYSLYSRETELLSSQLATTYGLLPSGGSDYHGTTKPDIQLGTGHGNLAIPYSMAINLKNMA